MVQVIVFPSQQLQQGIARPLQIQAMVLSVGRILTILVFF